MTSEPTTDVPHRSSTTGRVAAIIYNPVKVDLDELRAAFAAGSAGWGDPMWLETSEDDPGRGMAANAVKAGVDVVIAAGGDGTVRAVAEALRGSGVPLALLPSGTGNLLARNLELTLDDTAESIDAALNGVDRKIDIGVIDIRREDGEVDQRAFVVMAGLGIDAKMIENTNEGLKKRVGWLAYVDAIARSMRDASQLRLRFHIDEGPARSIRAHTLIVGNCGTLPANILLLPDARIDDGVFDIAFLRPKGFLGWVQIWWKVAWEHRIIRQTTVGRKLMGQSKEIRALEYDTAARLSATFARPEAIELDGDSFGSTIAFTAWVDPLGLTVRVPQPADEAGDER
ncbi:MAG: diacylglycerol kinase family protein [Pseudolysinimonas sp.]